MTDTINFEECIALFEQFEALTFKLERLARCYKEKAKAIFEESLSTELQNTYEYKSAYRWLYHSNAVIIDADAFKARFIVSYDSEELHSMDIRDLCDDPSFDNKLIQFKAELDQFNASSQSTLIKQKQNRILQLEQELAQLKEAL